MLFMLLIVYDERIFLLLVTVLACVNLLRCCFLNLPNILYLTGYSKCMNITRTICECVVLTGFLQRKGVNCLKIQPKGNCHSVFNSHSSKITIWI